MHHHPMFAQNPFAYRNNLCLLKVLSKKDLHDVGTLQR